MTEEKNRFDGEEEILTSSEDGVSTDVSGQAEPLIPGTEIIGRSARRAALLAEEEEDQMPLWDDTLVQNSPAEAEEFVSEPSEPLSREMDHAICETPKEVDFVSPEEPLPRKKGKKGCAVSPIIETVEVVVGALVAAILVLTLLFRTGVVEGDSMVPTMHHGDRYVISDLLYTPEQGDIIVFRPEIEGEEELWIKRIIALEGQTVYIDPDTYQVYVDGNRLDEPYLWGMLTIPHSTENPITVPQGCVYVLGDNRSISHDSRYEDLGCVPVGQIAGRVLFRFWPLDSFGFCD